MELKLADFAPAQIYHLMTQTIIPRPIAWVLTENMALAKEKRNFNLAPFSYFSAVSSNPPLLMISVGLKDIDTAKDTTINSQQGSKAVIHIAADDQFQDVTQSAATLPYGDSELDKAGINSKQLNDQLCGFEGFSLPRLQHCPIAFGCSVYEIQKIGNTPQTLIFFEIESVYIDDSAVSNDNNRLSIDAKKINPLSRLGAAQYASLGDIIEQKRPK